MEELDTFLESFREIYPNWIVGNVEKNVLFSGFLSNPGGANKATHRIVVRDPRGKETILTFNDRQLSQVPQWFTELAFEYEQGLL